MNGRIRAWLPDDRATPILDIGCGGGRLLSLLQHSGYMNLTGIDISSEQIKAARGHVNRATLLQADARQFLNGCVEQYGLICAFDVIEHLQKDEIIPFLRSVYVALRPGGRMILQTPNAESPWMGSVAFGDFTHEWFFTPASLRQTLQDVGFRVFEACESGPYVHGIKSLVRYVGWRSIRLCLMLWNLVETGGQGSGIYTRVFLATVSKIG